MIIEIDNKFTTTDVIRKGIIQNKEQLDEYIKYRRSLNYKPIISKLQFPDKKYCYHNTYEEVTV